MIDARRPCSCTALASRRGRRCREARLGPTRHPNPTRCRSIWGEARTRGSGATVASDGQPSARGTRCSCTVCNQQCARFSGPFAQRPRRVWSALHSGSIHSSSARRLSGAKAPRGFSWRAGAAGWSRWMAGTAQRQDQDNASNVSPLPLMFVNGRDQEVQDMINAVVAEILDTQVQSS